jgi:hypothetical protein
MSMRTLNLLSFFTFAGAASLGALESARADVRAFAEAHCGNCHDSTTHKAGLDLERLDLLLSERTNALTWELIFDRVASGEMPPKKSAQPSETDRTKFLADLGDQLRAASLARQERSGRGPVRRLTRLEYETTVKDLLHIHTDLSSLFPDDAVTAGFDKVGEGLTLSAAHFAAYQEAAEKALNMAITRGGEIKHDVDGAKIFNGRTKEFTNWGSWQEGEAMVIASQLNYPYLTILAPNSPRSGRYRITFTAQARNNAGKPLPVALGILDWRTMRPYAPETSLWFDVPENKPRTVTTELELDALQHVHLFGPALEDRNKVLDLAKKGERWTGRVLLLSRLKMEGPLKADGTLDEGAGMGYRELFDELPVEPLSRVTGVPPANGKTDPLVPVSATPKEDAARLLRRFLPRAHRRPVPEKTTANYVAKAHAALERGVTFHRAMLDSYKAVLCSPDFLLLEEIPGALDGYALASRLSYFLWNTAPDDTLRRAAANGELATRAGRTAQVERMLKDARAERFERSFVDQWLDLKRINATSPDGVLYPEIKPSMVVAAELETRRFFHDLLAEDRSVLESIQSDWTYANELLSALYDLAEADGYEMRKVPLPPQSRRGGFLTQASILKVTADGAKTSPILRGKWVNERILGVTPRPPPEDVAKIEPDIRGATTIREQLAKHRNSPACMSCHTVIDPPGFALETFDVMGSWRDFYRMPSHTGAVIKLPRFGGRQIHRGPAVEGGYTMPDGRAFADVTEYKALLLEDSERIVSALAAKLLTYATGAPVQFADREDVTAIVADLRSRHFGLRSLVHAVVQSRPFLHK